MPALPIDDHNDRDERSVEILSEVSLVYFKAEPANIGPFGASHLTWKVEGPAGFQVRLNLLPVTKTGGKVVQPASTAVYRLRAQAGQASKTLGQVTVNVDGTGCETFEPLLSGREAVQGLVELLGAVAIVPEGKRLRTVRIDEGNGGDGIIELTACPYDLLRNFAELSGVAVLR